MKCIFLEVGVLSCNDLFCDETNQSRNHYFSKDWAMKCIKIVSSIQFLFLVKLSFGLKQLFSRKMDDMIYLKPYI